MKNKRKTILKILTNDRKMEKSHVTEFEIQSKVKGVWVNGNGAIIWTENVKLSEEKGRMKNGKNIKLQIMD